MREYEQQRSKLQHMSARGSATAANPDAMIAQMLGKPFAANTYAAQRNIRPAQTGMFLAAWLYLVILFQFWIVFRDAFPISELLHLQDLVQRDTPLVPTNSCTVSTTWTMSSFCQVRHLCPICRPITLFRRTDIRFRDLAMHLLMCDSSCRRIDLLHHRLCLLN